MLLWSDCSSWTMVMHTRCRSPPASVSLGRPPSFTNSEHSRAVLARQPTRSVSRNRARRQQAPTRNHLA